MHNVLATSFSHSQPVLSASGCPASFLKIPNSSTIRTISSSYHNASVTPAAIASGRLAPQHRDQASPPATAFDRNIAPLLESAQHIGFCAPRDPELSQISIPKTLEVVGGCRFRGAGIERIAMGRLIAAATSAANAATTRVRTKSLTLRVTFYVVLEVNPVELDST